MGVSLIESQLRDCLKAAVDDHLHELDYDSPFLKIKLEPATFGQMRSRRFSLGEFVFINASISTVETLWKAMELCFPYHHASFEAWFAEIGRVPYPLDELKSALAWLFVERNRFVHELFDETFSEIGTLAEPQFFQKISRTHDFLCWVQHMKRYNFTSEDSEDHPSWGETGKSINDTNRRIDTLVKDFYTRLDGAKNPTEDSWVDSLRQALSNLIAVHQEYTRSMVEFSYASHGASGTVRNQIAATVQLGELEKLESTLKKGLEGIHWYESLSEMLE